MERPFVSDKTLLDFMGAVPFLLLAAVNTWHHAMWGDELHAWGVVLASSGLGDLFQRLHYEGHPGLWYILMWFASPISTSAMAMQCIHLAIAVATIIIVAVAAPFSRIEKGLLLLNYFLVYEYTVLARNYGATLLLGIIYAWVRTGARERPILLGLLLGLMGNTNVYGFVLASMLALEYTWNGAIATRRFAAVGYSRVALGASIFGALMLLCAVTVWPAADLSHHGQEPRGEELRDVARFGVQFLRTAVAPFFPVDFSFPTSFAFPGNLYYNGKRVWLSVAMLPLIAVALFVIFERQRRFILVLGGTALIAAVFSFAVYPSAIRHMGVMFVGFVALLWISRGEAAAEPAVDRGRPNKASAAVLGLLAAGALGGCLALAGQWIRPFAINPEVVRWLGVHEPPEFAMIGVPDIRVEPIAVLMHRRFYALECQCEDTYVRYLERRDSFTRAMIPERLDEAVRRYDPRPVVLLAGDSLTEPERALIRARGMALTERVHLAGAERDSEMTIFDVSRE